MIKSKQNFTNLQLQHVKEGIASAIVESISSVGVARVLIDGEAHSQDAACVTTFADEAEARKLTGCKVLVFSDAALSQPVILGKIQESMWVQRDESTGHGKLPGNEELSVQIDKQKINLKAEKEISLTCGHSSLLLRKDGTVIVRGIKIISRASQSNKIKGGKVNIN